MKRKYLTPEIKINKVELDIITFSETISWDGPVISVGNPSNEKSTDIIIIE